MSIILGISQIQTTTVVVVGFITCTVVFSGCLGLSYLGSKFLESAARQPELESRLFNRFLIMAALVDFMPLAGIMVAGVLMVMAPVAQKAVALISQIS